MKLIDKDALVAEIERIKKEECPTDTYEGRCKLFWFERFLAFVNTLEVKEVDLEEYYNEFLQKEWFESLHVRAVSEMMAFTAKHFFELGLAASNKAQKGE